jgi:hypothetical protein
MNRLFKGSFVIAILCYTTGALATDAIVKRSATLRTDPSTEHPPVTNLKAQEDVELIEPSPKSGYYHVRTAEGDEGWVYSRNLQIIASPPPSAATPAAPSAAPLAIPPAVARAPAAGVGLASSILADWERPAPNQTTYHGPDGGLRSDGGRRRLPDEWAEEPH